MRTESFMVIFILPSTYMGHPSPIKFVEPQKKNLKTILSLVIRASSPTGPVAQLEERRADNAEVLGSTPSWTKMCRAKVSSHFTPASVQKLFKALI